MIITTERLHYLWAVAETGSFSAAGRKLGYSPAAVQQAIQAFEYDIDAKLFERDPGKKPTLTELGKKFYLQALDILPKLEGLEKFALDVAQGQEAQLRVALHSFTLCGQYQDAIVALQKHFPTLELILLDADYAVLSCDKTRITNYPHLPLADIILSPGRLRSDHGGYDHIIGRIHWRIVASNKHPLSHIASTLSIDDLNLHTQLFPSPGVIFTEELNEGIRLSNKLIRYSHFYQLQSFLLSGLGFAVIPDQLARPLAEQGQLTILELDFDDGAINWGIELAWAPNLGKAGSWLVEQLQKPPQTSNLKP
ncbi:LysR family transcriptional regulator [Paraferrimonas haliotis]|uniref:LysR family transcriptional regulator n=1 Tax=Paraferrimonas haliotis TaxID=2013866 RepID=A0AA37WY97_9GAMM|nr:LysR family transcriptional regulator [Paraferrimonas haliotis]GLS85022.1 LysR family transcriptional regulator [Paraferrimonas haliotis]